MRICKTMGVMGAVLLSFSVSFVGLRPRPEPTWNKRTLSAWLDDLVRGSSKEVREPAEEAIRAIGSNAVPTLVRMLRKRDGMSQRILVWLNGKQKWMRFRIIPARQEHSRAWLGFQALGERGESAIPELGRLLVSNGKAEFVPESLSAISAKSVPVLLGALPQVRVEKQYLIVEGALRWPSEQWAIVEALRKLVSSRDREERICGAHFLGRCRRDPERAVEALVSALDDSDFWVRLQAVASLTQLGTNASAAVPVLRKMAEKPEFLPGFAASNAPLQIQKGRVE